MTCAFTAAGQTLAADLTPVRGRSVKVDAIALEVEAEMATAEVGAAYEVARSGPLAFDILGGAGYWSQEVDLSLERARTLDIGDL